HPPRAHPEPAAHAPRLALQHHHLAPGLPPLWRWFPCCGFPSPSWGGVRGGGNPSGQGSAIPPSLPLPHEGGGDSCTKHEPAPRGDGRIHTPLREEMLRRSRHLLARRGEELRHVEADTAGTHDGHPPPCVACTRKDVGVARA